MKKDKSVAILLCCIGFCGIGGLHDFYLGCIWLGIIKLLTCDFFFVGTIIDLILLVSNSYYVRGIQAKTQPTPQRTVTPSQTTYTATATTRISDEGIEWRNGTDNQIDWAEDLVKKLLNRAEELTNAAIKQYKIDEEDKDELIEALEDAIILQDDANWWIDNKGLSAKKLMLEILPEELHETVNLL